MADNQFQPPPPGTNMHNGIPAQPPLPGQFQPGSEQMSPLPPGSRQPGAGQTQPPPPGSQQGYPPGQMQPPPPGSQPGYPSGPNQMQPPPPGSQPGYPPGPSHMQPPPPGSQGGYVPPGSNQMQPPLPGSQSGYGTNQMQPPPPGSIPPGSNHQGSQRSQKSKESMLSSDDPMPSAPFLQQMDKLQGYENVSFNGAAAPPPAYHEVVEAHSHDRGDVSNLPQLAEDQVREALFHHVAEKCCYGNAAATEMVFNSLETTSAFHYKLESFTERRETCWAYEPYTGQVIDSAHYGRPPLPWEIQVIAPKSFVEGKADVEIPHTASVKKCHGCHGHGYKRCSSCHGHGYSKCFSCSGKGYVDSNSIDSNSEQRCIACSGTGERKCNRCNGHGDICCTCCDSTGELKCFISMTVTWTVRVDDHVVERTALPDKLIKTVSGQIALEEEQPRVWPVNHFPDSSINKASSDLVTKHVNNYPSERILMQRQQIRIIPVVQAFYKWHNKDGEFYVYGFEQKVYAPDYPQKCCWGCSIL